ncbi:hypothetical protein [Morganella morganii]|uniref:hypothetical protein n=1 Tax=Morganella morganii TaxID=582 RepID=UPI0034D7AB1C
MRLKLIITFLLFISINSHANTERADEKTTTCDVKIVKMARGNSHRLTLYYYGIKAGKYIPLYEHLSFQLQPSDKAYTFVKFAYLYNRKLCVRYRTEGNINFIANLYDDTSN